MSQLENVCTGDNWCIIDFIRRIFTMYHIYLHTSVCICARVLGSPDYGISTCHFSVDLFKLLKLMTSVEMYFGESSDF